MTVTRWPSVADPRRRVAQLPVAGFVRAMLLAAAVAAASLLVAASGAEPVRASQRMVISASGTASQSGGEVLNDGGNAVDAAVATAFALAVTHPTAGNIGGGGFLVYRAGSGDTDAYDFRETAPPGSSPTMWLKDGRYDPGRHHLSYLSVGVPGTVAGLHLAWKEHGSLPWKRLVEPAVKLARDGFVVSPGLARSLRGILEEMKPYPDSTAQFSKGGVPFEPGERLKQSDLARTLERIERLGPAGFYEGETARLVDQEMRAHGGLVTTAALRDYRAIKREPLRGSYRGYDLVTMPPPSGGGVGLIEMLNMHCRSRDEPGDAGGAADLEGLRRRAAAHHRREKGVAIVARELHLAPRERRNHPRLGRRRQPQCGVTHLHARVRLRLPHRRTRRRVPLEQ
jgi:gamma-glutamyltranspeptidase/glutathione hydrolase